MNKEELINKIKKLWGNTEKGCFVNGRWFSPQDIIKLIEKSC